MKKGFVTLRRGDYRRQDVRGAGGGGQVMLCSECNVHDVYALFQVGGSRGCPAGEVRAADGAGLRQELAIRREDAKVMTSVIFQSRTKLCLNRLGLYPFRTI